MSIEFVSGDIFDNEHGAQAIAHGVNLQGKMGAGIAKQVRERYPMMFNCYQDLCRQDRLKMGAVLLWPDATLPWVFNIATQAQAVRNSASLAALYEGITTMQMYMSHHRIARVAMPLIGTGIGGLGEREVRRLLHDAFDVCQEIAIVYDEYIPGE